MRKYHGIMPVVLISAAIAMSTLGVSSLGVHGAARASTSTTSSTDSTSLGSGLFGCTSTPTPVVGPLVDGNFDAGAKTSDWTFSAPTTAETGVIQDGIGQNGGYAAQITVPAGTAAGFPNFSQTIPQLSVGSTLDISSEVKTTDITAGFGAYIAVEYFNSSGTRITFAQSTGLVGTNGWTQMSFQGAVPPGTTSYTVQLLLNGTGIATFDDVQLLVTSGPDVAYQPTVTLTPTAQVLNQNLDGLGVQTNPFAFDSTNNLTPTELATVRKRLKQLSPAWARVFLNTAWWVKGSGFDFDTPMMKDLLQDIAMYRSLHAKVNLVLWNTASWGPPYTGLENDLVALLQWLHGKGMDNVQLLTLANEPDGTYYGGQYFPNDADYVAFYQGMRSVLDHAGMTNIGLVDGDVAVPDDAFVKTIAPQLKGTASVLSFHSYPDYATSLCSPVLQAKQMVQLGDSSGTPNVFMWESNLTGATGASFMSPGTVNGALLPTLYPTALKLSAFYLQVLAAGVKGMSYWEAFDYLYPGYAGGLNHPWMMSFGLWGPASQGMKLRPTYLAYELLSRFVQPGADIRNLQDSPDGAVIADEITNAGSRTAGIYVINPWDKALTANIPLASTPQRSVTAYLFDADTVQSALSRGQLSVARQSIQLGSNRTLTERLPAESMVLYTIKDGVVSARRVH